MSMSVCRVSLGPFGPCRKGLRALIASDLPKRGVKVPSRGFFGSKGGDRPGRSQSRVLSKDEGHLFEMESKLDCQLCYVYLVRHENYIESSYCIYCACPNSAIRLTLIIE